MKRKEEGERGIHTFGVCAIHDCHVITAQTDYVGIQKLVPQSFELRRAQKSSIVVVYLNSSEVIHDQEIPVQKVIREKEGRKVRSKDIERGILF